LSSPTLSRARALLRRLRMREKKPIKIELRKLLKSNLHPLLIMVLFFSLMFIMLSTSELVVIPCFVIGLIAVTSLFIIKRKSK
jgi:hypothetical protein